MMQRNDLGSYVRERRMMLGLTQEQLAERIGGNSNQADISRLERGRVELPRRSRLEALALALEVTLGQLLVHSGWLSDNESQLLDGYPDVKSRAEHMKSEQVLAELVDLREQLVIAIERVVGLETILGTLAKPSERQHTHAHTGLFNDWERSAPYGGC